MFRLRATNLSPDGNSLLPDRIAGTFETMADLLQALYVEGAEWATVYSMTTEGAREWFRGNAIEYMLDAVEDNPDHVSAALAIEVLVDGREWRELLGLTHRTVQTVVTESRIL